MYLLHAVDGHRCGAHSPPLSSTPLVPQEDIIRLSLDAIHTLFLQVHACVPALESLLPTSLTSSEALFQTTPTPEFSINDSGSSPGPRSVLKHAHTSAPPQHQEGAVMKNVDLIQKHQLYPSFPKLCDQERVKCRPRFLDKLNSVITGPCHSTPRATPKGTGNTTKTLDMNVTAALFIIGRRGNSLVSI